MAEITLSFPKSPQVNPTTIRFIVAPPAPPPFLQRSGSLTVKDSKYAGRKGSFFKRYPIEMQAGITYTIDLQATFDTYLFLENANGKILRCDDDGGKGLNSRIVHRATETSKHYLITTTYRPIQTGVFQFLVRKAE